MRLRHSPSVLPAGTPPFVSLNAVTATGNGNSVNFGHAYDDWMVQIETTGAPASISVDFQGCLDGVNFHKIGASITATGLTVFATQPLVAARLVLNTLTGGTSPTVSGTLAAANS